MGATTITLAFSRTVVVEQAMTFVAKAPAALCGRRFRHAVWQVEIESLRHMLSVRYYARPLSEMHNAAVPAETPLILVSHLVPSFVRSYDNTRNNSTINHINNK